MSIEPDSTGFHPDATPTASAVTEAHVLEARGVSRVFHPGTKAECRALQDINLTVARGECVAVTGPSGAGKSTLLAILSGLERPSSGQVLFEEKNLASFSDVELARYRRRVGIVFQDFALIDSLRVWENVSYPLIPRGVSRSDRYERARSLLARFALSEAIDKRPGELSGGEQQRVAIARALVASPEILFADEPTSNLDRSSATALIEIFRQLHQQDGKTLVISTHDERLIAIGRTVFELPSPTRTMTG